MVTKNLEEAGKIFKEAVRGDLAARGRVKALVDGSAYISESISTSDIAKAFAIGIKQTVEEQYNELPKTWRDIAQPYEMPDFRPDFLRELWFDQDVDLAENGGETTDPWSLPNVPEGTEYPTFYFSTSGKALQLAKKGARLPFTWEMVINDQWNLIQSIPSQMLTYAANTEDASVYKLLASSTGPNSTTFSAANGNLNNDLFNADYALSLDAVLLAKKAIRHRKINGRWVTVNKFRLVVPTTLREQAEVILNTTEVEARNADQTRIIQSKVPLSDVALTVSDTIQRLDKTANAETTWYLVPDGGSDGTRKSLVNCFLTNHTTPELRVSADGGQYIGGGEVGALEGGLLDDKIEYRVRHVVSGGLVNGNALLASKGTAGAAPSQITA
jgi:hypothetical protein